jgi:hypothetical protein
MTDNKYTGEAPIRMGGRVYTLAYDWQALARIRTELADTALDLVLSTADPEALSKLIAIGLARHHPEMSAPAVMAASPPFMPSIAAVKYALNAAYWGPEGPPPEVAGENPPGRLARTMAGLRITLSRLWPWRTGRA